MKKFSFKKRDIKYAVTLTVLLVLAVIGFVEGARDAQEYKKNSENAVAVEATVEQAHLQYREETHWNAGAGDDIDKEVTKVPYYTYSISYTFEGKEYRRGYGGESHTGELSQGEQIEILIDSSDPERIITEQQAEKPNFYFAYMFLSFFLILLLVWIIRRLKAHK